MMNTQPVVLPSVRTSGTPSWAERQEHFRDLDRNRIVEFCHPGYEHPHNVLFRLCAIEPEPESEAPTNARRFGVHHDTARIACATLANNAWDGYLTIDEPTGPRIPIDEPERILVDHRYYFHHPSYPPSNPKYPVVADFASWQFPSQLPSYWRSLIIPPAVLPAEPTQARPQCCMVTGRHMPLEAAHLIPLSYTFWFNINSMERFQLEVGQDNINWINQPYNICHLTRDIHHISGQGSLVFVPRPCAVSGGGSPGIATYAASELHPVSSSDVPPRPLALVNYVLKPDRFHELVDCYHLRSLEPLMDIAPEYIFANFAYAIFCLCTFFKSDGRKRACVQLVQEDGEAQYKTRDNPLPSTYAEFKKPSRSPTKRRIASESPVEKRARSTSSCQGRSNNSQGGVDSPSSGHHVEDSSQEEELMRGRSLRRALPGRVPGLTRSPYSPELDPLAMNTSWTVTEEPFPVVIDDSGHRSLGLHFPAAHTSHGRKRSRSHSEPRKRLKLGTDI